MRRCSGLALALCLVTSATVGASPKIACRAPRYDFGTTNDSRRIGRQFTIWNDGDQLLKVGRVRACCGGSARISNKLIRPGSKAMLDVSLSLRGRRGRQHKSFYVASNDPRRPFLQLSLIGTVIPDVDVQPRHLNFGSIRKDARLRRTVAIQCRPGRGFSITNIVVDSARFTVVTTSSSPHSHQLTVQTAPPLPAGISRGKVVLYTDNPRTRTLTVGVQATVSSQIVCVPRELVVLRRDGPPQPAIRMIALRSRDKSPFRILDVVLPEQGIEVKTDPLGKGGYRLTLSNILPFPDLGEKRFVIKTDCKGAPEVEVPVRVVDASGRR